MKKMFNSLWILTYPFATIFAYLMLKKIDIVLSIFVITFLTLLMLCAIILYLKEKLAFYAIKKITFYQMIIFFISSLFSIILTFASVYWCIYKINPCAFTDISTNDNFLQTFFEFIYYSCGLTIMSSLSEIRAVSLVAKLISMANAFFAFIVIIVIFTNFKYIGIEHKKHLKINKNSDISTF